MSTTTVAWKDFEDAVRSRTLIGLSVVFVLFAVGATYLFAEFLGFAAAPNLPPAIGLIVSLLAPIVVFVPLIGVMTGYKSVVGERETGSVKLLLALPHTRRDVVFGKLLGRVAVLAVAIVAGFAAAGGMAFVLYDSFPFVEFVAFTLVTVLLGVVYLAFAIGLSASTGSGSVALWGSLGFFILFQFLWQFVAQLLAYVVNGFSNPQGFAFGLGYFPPNAAPDWYRLVQTLSPGNAYRSAVGSFLPQSAGPATQANAVPYFLEDWFGFVVLAIWVVVPLVLGYLRFEKTDL